MKRRFLKGSVLVVMALAFAGCSVGSEKPAASSNPSPKGVDTTKPEVFDTTKPGKLIFLAGADPTAGFNANDYLKKKFPNLEIEYHHVNDLEKVLLSGVKPDLVHTYGSILPQLKDANMLADMSDLIKKNKFDVNQFLPGHLDYIKQFGKGLVAVPDSTTKSAYGYLALAYNKDIFDQAGISYPKDGMTWDEVLKLASKLNRTDGGRKIIGLSQFWSMFYAYKVHGLTYLNKDGKADLSNPKWEDVFKTNSAMLQLGPVNELWSKPEAFYKDKNIAMYAGPVNIFFPLVEQGQLNDFNWDMVTFPVLPGDKPKSIQAELGVWEIPSTSEHKDLAFQFIQATLSDENLQGINNKLLNSPMKDKNLNAIDLSKQVLVPYVQTKYEKDWQGIFGAITRDTTLDPNTALRRTQEELQKKIDDTKK